VTPGALPSVAVITEALARVHPGFAVSVRSLSAEEIARRVLAFELDVGLAPLDAAPAGQLRTAPLYDENYLLATPHGGPFGDRDEVSWAEAAGLPLCLLSDDRHLVDGQLRQAGVTIAPPLETDSLTVLGGQLRTGRFSAIVPGSWPRLCGLPERVRLVRLAGPPLSRTVGLLALAREPAPAVVRALLATATEPDIRTALEVGCDDLG
jgi:DNA-binding transcriptional LysR family regulator